MPPSELIACWASPHVPGEASRLNNTASQTAAATGTCPVLLVPASLIALIIKSREKLKLVLVSCGDSMHACLNSTGHNLDCGCDERPAVPRTVSQGCR